MDSTTMLQRLPFELLAAVCAQLPQCPCATAGTQVFSVGCTGNHAPGAFGRGSLAVLRQTSRAWRAAALGAGLAQIVSSNRWMRGGAHDRLDAVHSGYARCVRRLVFRSSDYYPDGRRRTRGDLADELEAVLALAWPSLEAVVVEWFSGSARDHARIAAAVRRWAPRARELYVHDKLVSLGAMGEMAALGSHVRRLAVKPYGYNQRWSALLPHERGGARMLARMPAQLTALAIGGSDFTPELLSALQRTQPCLKFLSVEHAWIDALSADVCLPSVTRLSLENVVFARGAVLPLTPRMFPALRALTLRYTWQHAPDGSRGAVSLQDERCLSGFCAAAWPHLRALALPAVADIDAVFLARACPQLERLATNSLDYAGPALSAAGLVDLLRGLPRLRHLSIEQRRADGSPGYSFADAALCRLIGAADDDTRFGDRLLNRLSTASTLVGSDTEDADSDDSADSDAFARMLHSRLPRALSASLNTLFIPRASLTASTLDALLKQLPNLVKLSVSLRADSLVGLAKIRPWAHHALKWIAVSADEDILADPMWLSAWLVQRFPMLQECCMNDVRSHKQMVAGLRAAAPAVSFTRLNSRALQT
ncbi:hypothetical protein IWW50_006043 [Coemansia erecta]|nr:hypothetical protein GGF43_002490 [Coemansia sp. RSA 2618]KAJ2817792.1 hypothetical protein IWW50_006043 [Coemansia erecta]